MRRLALIGWSAADWKIITPLLDAGRMPALASLVENGVKGDLAALSPMVSPMLWASLLTGKPPEAHGVLGAHEPDEATGSVRRVTSTGRKCKALWNILSENGLRTLAVNWITSQPVEPILGAVVSDLFPAARAPHGYPWPLAARTIHPASLTDSLAALRIHPGDFTGDDLLHFLPDLAQIDQKQDKRPLQLAIGLAESVTVHAAAVHLLLHEPWDVLAVHYSALGGLSRLFLADRHVVESLYCYYDQLLARLVELAGPETIFVVVSEQGEGTHGIFCAAGPGIRKDDLVFGAGILDVLPFVLTAVGVAPGRDMPGRILREAFVEPPSDERRVPTWEADTLLDSIDEEEWDGAAALAALGILPEVEDAMAAAHARESDATLAQVHMAAGRFAEAIPLLKKFDLVQAQMALAYCYHALRRHNDGLVLIERVLAEHPEEAHAWLIRADLALSIGDTAKALELLDEASRRGASSAILQLRLGDVYARMRQWGAAEAAYSNAIGLDSSMRVAHTRRARALLELGQRDREAAEVALDAIALGFEDADAHLYLGIALVRQQDRERAAQALRTCLRFRPGNKAAARWLSRL